MFLKVIHITPICVQIHYLFHYILNEIEKIYHGENHQIFNKHGLVVIDR
jgi:hypothetical protein